MASTLHRHSENAQTSLYNSRAYVYYSRYPVSKPSASPLQWRKALRIVWHYTNLMLLTIMTMTLGAVFPILIANEFFFKPVFANDCEKCLVIGTRPFFEIDLISASFMVVLGCVVPLLTALVLVKVLRSAEIRRELFY